MTSRRHPRVPPWKAPPATSADAVLIARANWLSAAYPLLRLRLARFAWGGDGVEARARVALRDWGRSVFANIAEDARRLDVPAERFFRNLLPVLPGWAVPVLVVLARRDRRIRGILDGLRLDFACFPDHAARIADFDLLFAARRPIEPDIVARMVRLRPAALERAKARWQARRAAARSDAAAPGEGSAADASSASAAASIGDDAQAVDAAALDAMAVADIRLPRSADRLELLSRAMGSRGSDTAAMELLALARWARRGDPRLLEAIGTLLGKTPLPDRACASLLAVLPRRTRRPAIQALRLFAAGREGARSELAAMSARRGADALRAFSSHAGDGEVLSLAAAAALPAAAHGPRGGLAAAVELLVENIDTPEQIVTMLGLGGRLRASWRNGIATCLEELGSKSDGFSRFLDAAGPLQPVWPRLHPELREAALALWVKAVKAQPELRRRAVDILPALALDAARWAGDNEAIADLIAGPEPARGFALLLRLDAAERARIWVRLRRRIPPTAALPEPWLEIARRDRRVLDLLLAKALPRIARSPLAALPLVPLMDASLRNRRLAQRLAAEHGHAALAAAMPALRRRLAGRTRRRAAAELALLLGWENAVFLAFLATRPYAAADRPGTRFDRLYHSWDLPKRKGGTRRITAPQPLLRTVQRRLLDVVFAKVPCHRAATGFRRGVSIADNARPHVGRKVVVNVDLQGFFPNTRFKHVRRAVERVLPRQLGAEARRLVVDICTMDGGLPIGAPSSPAIANIVMQPVDRALAKVAARHGVAYTRYADDLTLSGDDPLRLLPFLRQLVGQLGYSLDPKKTNIFRRGRRQVVTGLVVNDKVSVPRRLRRRLRAAAHRVALHGAGAELTWHGRPMNPGELAGHVAFIGIAHPEESRALAERLRAGLSRNRRGARKGKP
jgi:retron-type reverse transcriptase